MVRLARRIKCQSRFLTRTQSKLMFCSTPTTEPTTEEEDKNHQPSPAFHPNAPLHRAHRRRRLLELRAMADSGSTAVTTASRSLRHGGGATAVAVAPPPPSDDSMHCDRWHRRRRRQHRATTALRSLRRGGGATTVAVAVAIKEGYQCEWDALTLCLHLA